MREDANLAAVDGAEAGDDAVAGNFLVGHFEIDNAMGLELIELDERAAIEQKFDSLARGHAPRFTLLFKPIRAAAKFRAARQFLHPVEVFFKSHVANVQVRMAAHSLA